MRIWKWGDISIKPESSDNLNFNLSYNRTFGRHSVYMEGGVIYRNTKDYIQRNIADLSGGKYAAKYINYGKVLTERIYWFLLVTVLAIG